jgi:hypothetical protein
MDHMRKQIRSAVLQALLGLKTTRRNVFATRTVPLNADTLPGLCVYTLSEQSGVDTMGKNRSLKRMLDLVIEGVTKSRASIDDDLDQIAAEVETAMALDPSLGGLAYDCVLQSTKIAVRGVAETDTGSVQLTYSVTYRTKASDPTINSI